MKERRRIYERTGVKLDIEQIKLPPRINPPRTVEKPATSRVDGRALQGTLDICGELLDPSGQASVRTASKELLAAAAEKGSTKGRSPGKKWSSRILKGFDSKSTLVADLVANSARGASESDRGPLAEDDDSGVEPRQPVPLGARGRASVSPEPEPSAGLEQIQFQPLAATQRKGQATFTIVTAQNPDLRSERARGPSPSPAQRRRLLNIEGDRVTQLSPESLSPLPRSGRPPSPRAPFAYEGTSLAAVCKEKRF